MKKYILLMLLILIISCTKKEIKIPTLDAKGIQEIHNHSQVFFFFEIKNNDTIAKLNKKNTISMSDLKNGVYFLRISDKVHKVIKMN